MFQNSRMQAAKKLQSPSQPLIAEQMGAVRAAAKEEWFESIAQASGEATTWQRVASTPRSRGANARW
jgi:hypothetical protein